MSPRSCDDIRAILSDLLAGDADAEASAAVESHLASCEACRSLSQDLVWQDLAIAEMAGRSLTRGILARVRGPLEAWPPKAKRRGGWIAFAAAAVAAGLLLVVFLFRSDAPSAPPETGTARRAPAPPASKTPAVEEPARRAIETPPPAPERPVETPLPPAPRRAQPSLPEKPAPPPPEPPRIDEPPAPAVRPATTPAIARLVRLRGDVRAGAAAAREGQDLLEGGSLEMREGSGRSVVEFPDGTQVELHRNTVVSSLSASEGKRIVLEKGSVTARVAPQPKASPMVFATPHGEATVVGTVLRIAVSPDPREGMRVEVEQGQVRLKRASDGRNVVLAGGQTAVAAEGKLLAARKLLPPLEELSSRLAPGSWTELETDGFELPAILVKPWMHVVENVEEAKWDPVQRQLHLLGFATQEESHYWLYDERTNAWERRPAPPGESWFGPAYDHVAFDPAARALFFRQHNHDLVHQLDLRTGSWSALPRMPSNPAEIGALELYPEMGGLVFAGGGNIYLYRFKTKKWEVLARLLDFGPSDAFAEYDPVHKVMFIGGGTGKRTLYRLEPAGTLVSLKEAPLGLGLKDALVVVEPAGGRLLALSRPDGRVFHEYDVAQNRWTPLEPPALPVMRAARGGHTAAAAVSGAGVVLFLAADAQSAGIYAYRHGTRR